MLESSLTGLWQGEGVALEVDPGVAGGGDTLVKAGHCQRRG